MTLNLDRAALLWHVTNSTESKATFKRVADDIRDEARENARVITDKTDAIVSELGADGEGIYADVGYAKHHPGFFLWWHEVGTQHLPPRPHLRPALRPRL